MTDTRIKPEQAVHGATGGNMKRMAAAVLAAMMVFSLAACAGAEEETVGNRFREVHISCRIF